jgi:hypothetical protein
MDLAARSRWGRAGVAAERDRTAARLADAFNLLSGAPIPSHAGGIIKSWLSWGLPGRAGPGSSTATFSLARPRGRGAAYRLRRPRFAGGSSAATSKRPASHDRAKVAANQAPNQAVRRSVSNACFAARCSADGRALDVLPKVELRCHVEGTKRPQTLVELAAGKRRSG